MNKKIIFAVLGIVLLISFAIAYVLLTPEKSAAPPAEPSKKTAQNEPAKVQTEPGTYTEYSEKAALAPTGTKILFFHAPWCPQCRAIEASIETDGVPTGVTVLKVDYDSNQELRQRYGVTLQTTFVKIDDNGNKIASYVAYETPHFDSVKAELLP
jgi:thiol-disulfide isomerase/thioredoxin